MSEILPYLTEIYYFCINYRIISSYHMKKSFVFCLLLFAGITAFAQQYHDEYFTYSDEDLTTIDGLTYAGLAEEVLTIPSRVTMVSDYSFADTETYNNLKRIVVEDGGNPDFEPDALTTVSSALETIHLGNAMTASHMKDLFVSLGEGHTVTDFEMTAYDVSEGMDLNVDDYPELAGVLTEGVRVKMPAEMVADQVFGNSVVYGRFDIAANLEIATFCVNQYFQDTDDGSNMLFYIPLRVNEATSQIYIKRLHYINPGEGFLMHPTATSSRRVYLPRINPETLEYEDLRIYEEDMANYTDNMLVGVLEPTPLTKTAVKDGVPVTNMILYNGVFHPTSGGTLGANRAYLQVETEKLNAMASTNLTVIIDDDTDGVATTTAYGQKLAEPDAWYTLSGQRLGGEPTQKGLYINGGKKVLK